MPKFVFIYRNANPPASPEAAQQHMADWREWSQSLGKALINPGMPFAQTVAVTKEDATEDIGANRLNGFSVVEVSDCHEARAFAERCPHLNIGGDIVIAEGVEMEM
ncbi:hypothetical protein [Aurantiacibacter sp. D1-12]|uniref:hypothetical protein n=1 Tax=Aurantiacibacter sp. D1-12 TaxID=2993658 RepID=UPI00237CBC11|nr:hypothetical protein [Aurantiacibacter sp. D1-12]MDE1467079.1 hypothetical protein [Aurantiacibacter sp. D1-12]